MAKLGKKSGKKVGLATSTSSSVGVASQKVVRRGVVATPFKFYIKRKKK